MKNNKNNNCVRNIDPLLSELSVQKLVLHLSLDGYGAYSAHRTFHGDTHLRYRLLVLHVTWGVAWYVVRSMVTLI